MSQYSLMIPTPPSSNDERKRPGKQSVGGGKTIEDAEQNARWFLDRNPGVAAVTIENKAGEEVGTVRQGPGGE